MHIPPVEGNFKDGGKAVKPLVIKDYTTQTGHTDLSDIMVNSYSISKKTWKCMEKLFFHLLNLIILKKSCVGNMTHLKFWEQLLRDLVLP
jgi:hypothetical protein